MSENKKRVVGTNYTDYHGCKSNEYTECYADGTSKTVKVDPPNRESRAAGYSGEKIIESRNKETDNRLVGGGYSPTNINTTRINATTDTVPDKDNPNQDPKKDKKKNAT